MLRHDFSPYFDKYGRSEYGYKEDLLPIIPSGAKISFYSGLSPDRLGKILGKEVSDGWIGFERWTEHKTRKQDITEFKKYKGAGIGLQSRNYPAIDVDVTDVDLAARIETLTQIHLGPAPVRTGNYPKRLLAYRRKNEGTIKKTRVTITNKTTGEIHHVEILGQGQQFVVRGIHPKTKKSYEWKSDIQGAGNDLPPGKALTPVDEDDIEDFLKALEDFCETNGFSCTSSSVKKEHKNGHIKDKKQTISSNCQRLPIGDEKLRGDPDKIISALGCLPNHSLDYETWITYCHAIKAAFGGDESHFRVFEEWCLQYEGNTPAVVREKWDSIKTSLIGAEFLYDRAHAAGWDSTPFVFDVIQMSQELKTKPSGAFPGFIEEIENHWCYVIKIKAFVDLSTLDIYDKEQFDDIHSGKTDRKKPSNFSIGYRGMPKVTMPTYAPGQEKFVNEDGYEKVNLYRESGLQPAQGDVGPYIEYIEYLIGPDDAWIVHDFIAHLVRNPGDKVLWALLVQGKQGIGKSLLGRIIGKLFGEHNIGRPTNAVIHEKYTDWIKNKQFIIVEELMANERLGLLNKLKDLITEPIINIREMYRGSYPTRNRANFLFFTNYENSLLLPSDDRRYAVIFSPAEPRERKYYQKLVKWIDENSAVILHYYLQDHKLDPRFSAKGHAPVTEAKRRMIANSEHPAVQEIRQMVEDFVWPCDTDLVSADELRKKIAGEFRGVSVAQFTHFLNQAGLKSIKRLRLAGKSGPCRLIAVRNGKRYGSMSSCELRKAYEEQRKQADNAIFDESKA